MPAWKQRLSKSLHQARSIPESRYFQLATVTNDVLPANRTVVFRYMDDDDLALAIIADTRSAKWQELKLQPQAEICWYFSKSREQYRFKVEAQLHTIEDKQELIRQQWERLSETGRKQYFWGMPGNARNSAAPLRVSDDMDKPPAHFCVIKFHVKAVDYLSLQGNPQYREKHWMDEQSNWLSQPVIP